MKVLYWYSTTIDWRQTPALSSIMFRMEETARESVPLMVRDESIQISYIILVRHPKRQERRRCPPSLKSTHGSQTPQPDGAPSEPHSNGRHQRSPEAAKTCASRPTSSLLSLYAEQLQPWKIAIQKGVSCVAGVLVRQGYGTVANGSRLFLRSPTCTQRRGWDASPFRFPSPRPPLMILNVSDVLPSQHKATFVSIVFVCLVSVCARGACVCLFQILILPAILIT